MTLERRDIHVVAITGEIRQGMIRHNCQRHDDPRPRGKLLPSQLPPLVIGQTVRDSFATACASAGTTAYARSTTVKIPPPGDVDGSEEES